MGWGGFGVGLGLGVAWTCFRRGAGGRGGFDCVLKVTAGMGLTMF